MRNFTTEDFSGAGQYLIRNDKPPGEYTSPSFMSTILYKVGWITPMPKVFVNCPDNDNIYTLTSMADGMTRLGYFDKSKDPGKDDVPRTITYENTKTWIYIQFDGLQILCNYLNNPELCQQEYRFATQEEVVRVVMYQKSRWK